MTSSIDHAVKVIHYVSCLIIFTYYLLSTVWNICTLKAGSTVKHPLIKKALVCLNAVVALTFVVQSALVITLIFKTGSPYGNKDTNVYSLSGALLWIMFTGTFASTDKYAWYPYIGSWILTLGADVVPSALTASHLVPSSQIEWAFVSLQLVRDVAIIGLLFLYLCIRTPAPSADAIDEETTPLLEASAQETDNAEPNTEEAGGEEGEDEENKKDKERRAKLMANVEKEGNWFAYLKRFSIFVQFIWPFNRPLLQLNIIGVGLCVLAARVWTVLIPLQLGYLVNALGTGSLSQAFAALGWYALVKLLGSSAGTSTLHSLLWIPVRSNAAERLRTASYDHIMDLSSDFHDSKRSGELYQAMHQGSSMVNLLSTVLYDMVPVFIDLFIACFYFYFLFDVYLVLIGVAIGTAFVWVSFYLTQRLTKLRRVLMKNQRAQEQAMYDTLGEWKTVSYFNAIRYAKDKYATVVHLYQRVSRRYSRTSYINYAIQYLVLDLGTLAAMSYALYQIIKGGKDVGSFVTLITYWGTFEGQLPYLMYMHRQLIQNLVDAEELLALFQQKPKVADGPNELSIQGGEVKFENIGFAYDGKKETIRDVSFSASPGQTIAFVGETGAGKSTILKLLFRFYDVSAGAITIDGQDIRDVTLASLREHMGVVPQDPSLFNDTVMANIRFARQDATDDEVVEACKAAAIHDKIETFPNKYHTKVGERGVKLSGGELQRVAIARAMLKNPKIILLDEATSSVDSETEAKIQDGLKELAKGRTTFVVAHRLSTVMHANRILVINEGTIQEQGTPAELQKGDGKYQKLWNKQMGITNQPAEESDISSSTAATRPNSEGEAMQRNGTKGSGQGKQTDGINGAAEAGAAVLMEREQTGSTLRSSHPKSPFRPDAPEFIPQSHRGSDALADRIRLFEAASRAHTTENGSKKAGPDSRGSGNEELQTGSTTNGTHNSSNYGTMTTSGTGVSSRVSQSGLASRDSVPSLDGTSMRPTLGGPTVPPARRLSEPREAVTPVGEGRRRLPHQQQRGRRARNSTVGGGDGSADTGSFATNGDDDWAAEAGAVPGAPHSTPADGVSPNHTRPGSST